MLMEEMPVQPVEGDYCRVKYSGYTPNGRHDVPAKEGVGEYKKTHFWGGDRYQRVFHFRWGAESIYDDHDVFECEIIRCAQHPEAKASPRALYGGAVIIVCRKCQAMLADVLDEPIIHPRVVDPSE
jgi:predicted amidohydrolase